MIGKRNEREETSGMATMTDAQEQAERLGQGQTGQQKAKPLRFVTNYGAPHPKRRRIGAACLTCAYNVNEFIPSDS